MEKIQSKRAPSEAFDTTTSVIKSSINWFDRNVFPFLKFFNIAFLILFLIGFFLGMEEVTLPELPTYLFIILFCLPPVVASIVIGREIRKHEFYEWDKRERRKKRNFLRTLNFDVHFFSYLSISILTTSVYSLIKLDIYNLDQPEIIVYSLSLFYGILLFINAIFPVKMHHKLYEDELFIEDFKYEIQPKPDNWDVEYERTAQDYIREFYG